MTWHTLFSDFLTEFKNSWPAHGLPDDLQTLSVLTEGGRVVGFEGCGAINDGIMTVYGAKDLVGPALAMLIQDCALVGEIVRPVTSAFAA